MGFDMDDVLAVLQIVKELKDTELHIEVGDVKLSILKGDVGDQPRGFLDASRATCQTTTAHHQTCATPVAAELRQETPSAVTPPVNEPSQEPVPAPAIRSRAHPQELVEEGLVAVRATVTSVFYRRPSPSEPPFVEVGDIVEEDTPLCLLEVMKCFRQVLAGVRGRIEKICVESNTFVEKGDILFLIRPLWS